MALTFTLLALAGIVIGMLSGMLGIGGGTLIIPLLRLVCGLSPLQAVGTSLFTIIPTSFAGLIPHLRDKTTQVGLGLIFGIAGSCFAVLGAKASEMVPGFVIMIVAGCVIIYTAVNMLRKAKASGPKPSAKASTSEDKSAAAETAATGVVQDGVTSLSEKRIVFSRTTVLKACAIGAFSGFMSGFIGVGGGFIMVPLSVWLFELTMSQAAGTSLIAIVILAIPGVITHGMAGDVVYLQGIALAVGTIPGAIAGGVLGRKISDRVLRIVFGVILVIVGIFLVVNEFL